jgi:NAD(P)-dependent dehydrogenase (short-subunit alcohol dehydrogenase family)
MTRPVALVTGGATRIGRVIVDEFLNKGWHVALHCFHSIKEAQALKASLTSKDEDLTIFQANLQDEYAYSSLVDRIYQHYGRFDALIHNASVFKYDDVLTCTRQTWQEHFEVNLRAPFVLSQKFAEITSEQTRNIIFLIDQRVLSLTPYFMSYTLTKSALWTLTQTLSMALAPDIRVNAIAPGPTLPSVHQSLVEWERQCTNTLLQKATHPQEIADAVFYILNAPSFTGQMITLDNGQHMGWCFPKISSKVD